MGPVVCVDYFVVYYFSDCFGACVDVADAVDGHYARGVVAALDVVVEAALRFGSRERLCLEFFYDLCKILIVKKKLYSTSGVIIQELKL